MRRTIWVVAALAGLGTACDPEFQPSVEEDLVVRATFIEHAEDRVIQGIVPVLDGIANNLEWGSPDDPSRPFTFVQLTAANGFGNPGASKFIAVKCAYTAVWNEETMAYALRNVYFLLQWADLTPSRFKDSMVYGGPDLAAAEPRIRSFYESQGMTPLQAQAAANDSLARLFYDASGRLKPDQWRQDGGDDRLLLLLGTGDELGPAGRRFENFGLQVAQNGASFGPLGEGFLDAWVWSATRTNPICEPFNPDDIGGDVSPIEGFSGYADDYYLDAETPITKDTGPLLYLPNFDETLPPERRVPLRAYFPQSDPNATRTGVSKCIQPNFGMDFPPLHRGSVRGAVMSPQGNDNRVFNFRVFRWDTKDPQQGRFWTPGDFVAGYVYGHDFRSEKDLTRFVFCMPACPRPLDDNDTPNCDGRPYATAPHLLNSLQVRANGDWSRITRHWVVEMARPVRTQWGSTGDGSRPIHDLDFARFAGAGSDSVVTLLDAPFDFYISIALWDDRPDDGAYWGSPPVRLHFEPPPPREET